MVIFQYNEMENYVGYPLTWVSSYGGLVKEEGHYSSEVKACGAFCEKQYHSIIILCLN